MNSVERSPWTILVLVCVAQFMVVLDASIVNVALPTIGNALDFSESNLPWVLNAYVLTFGGFLLLGGRVADFRGRRRVFMFGLVLFAVASLAGGLATSAGQLIAARAVQGLGGRSSLRRRCRSWSRHSVTALSATGRSASGEPSRAAPGLWACCSGACSPRAWAGSGSSGSTSRSV